MKELIEKYKGLLTYSHDMAAYAIDELNKERLITEAKYYRTFITELEVLQARDAGKMVNDNGTKNC